MLTGHWLLGLGLLAMPVGVGAHNDVPNLELGLVGSFQVTAEISAPPATGLSLEVVETPFIDALRKRGRKIDQNNYDHVVAADVQIASSGSQYAVALSFSYRERCVASRLKLQVMCPLWERNELLKVFSSLDDASDYVITTTKAAAKLFDAEFDRK